MAGQAGSAWERIECVLAGYPLLNGDIDPAIEEWEFPPMVRLYKHLASERRWLPPRQDVFAQAVAERVFVDHPDAPLYTVLARANRTYISLVVQHHAHAVLSESYRFVVWDDVLDMQYNVDLLVVTDDGMVVGLKLSAPTSRSRRFVQRKDDQGPSLPFETRRLVVVREQYTAGKFWLYRPDDLRQAVEDAAHAQRGRVCEPYFQAGYREGRDAADGALP